ncbi:putative integral membrane protein [Halobacteriovorax marinus SJ]|uniref:Integral membrane protein n=1 Tax=Halobacteriovorax marinus (strain ATCC BAA-682 / DSM 15412 / SJ) TaxID=862908 RepID=E1X1R8_HALMS|nr:hypothetical protein [Halobacteriovorax marinus]CBW24987.1 putative integral membrane protein [Halobacteriovorax marinus SJ]
MIDISNLKIRQDIDRVNLLQWGHFSILTLAFIVEGFLNVKIFWTLFSLIGLGIFYKLYFKTLTDLYYSFWTFSFATASLIVYKLYHIIMSQSDLQLFYLYLVAGIILSIEAYILLSPIYYPRVSWWEYDFRYRDDLKVKFSYEEKEFEARLTDLRRSAGCLASFEEVSVGDKIKIFASNGVKEFSFLVEIMSRRRYSLGRPCTHGVKFIFNDEYLESDYDEFHNYWVNEKVFKRSTRYRKQGSNA